jgi:molybdopterin molybdotransferase
MISVEEARAALLAILPRMGAERAALRHAAGRVLVADAVATRDQPPFAAAAMDGYAVAHDVAPGDVLRVVGRAQAGAAFAGALGPGEAVRIFTGAPVPPGARRIVIQEDALEEAGRITIRAGLDAAAHIRPAGADFRAGDRHLAPRRLSAADLALLAAMNLPEVEVTRRPVVAIVPTGDELVMPGEVPGPDQIVASNVFALAALAEAEGAEARLLPIARDTAEALGDVLALARGCDLVVTDGGASVGEHDLVADVAAGMGLARAFARIAMRPGKPLMAGRMPGGEVLLGLPGNPVSAIVCGHLFLVPALRAMQGLADPVPRPRRARLLGPLPSNGPRAHYMRARIMAPEAPLPDVEVFADQDSARLRLLTDADALVIRSPHAPAALAGAEVDYLPI